MLSGLPLSDTSLRDPLLEIQHRRLRWLYLLANSPWLVGIAHRTVAWKVGGAYSGSADSSSQSQVDGASQLLLSS